MPEVLKLSFISNFQFKNSTGSQSRHNQRLRFIMKKNYLLCLQVTSHSLQLPKQLGKKIINVYFICIYKDWPLMSHMWIFDLRLAEIC